MTDLVLAAHPIPEFHTRRSRTRRLGRAYFWLLALPLVLPLASIYDPFFDVPAFGLGDYQANVVEAIMVGEAALGILALLALRRFPRRVVMQLTAYGAFLGWIVLNTLWTRPYWVATLHAAAFLVLGTWIAVAATLAADQPARTARVLGWSMLALDVLGLAVAVHQLVTGAWRAPFNAFLVNPRLFAMIAIAPVSWHLARWYHGRAWEIAPVGLWAAAVFLSLSRLATGTVALLLLVTGVLAALRRRRARPAGGLTGAGVPATVALVLAVAAGSVASFHDRLFDHDPESTAPLGVEFSGRLDMWDATLRSAARAPLVGQGMGANHVLLEHVARFRPETHPHNEFIRIGHDLGLVGLVLFVVAVAGWLRVVAPWHGSASDEGAELRLAGLLGLAGFVCLCLAEQPFVHPGVVGAVAVLVGAGVGAARDEQWGSRRV